ncbi:MAG TPA: pyridoxal-phosphate dependent enzyme [Saprospiraceae bacterium]|nr:pyridoxal-phosphate dependent enzyme [Saprospiraceae bacterium]
MNSGVWALIFHRFCRKDDDFRVFLCIVSFPAAHHFSHAKVVAAEPTGADDAYRSLRDGVIHLSEHPNTICDGLRTNLGDINFPIIKELLQEILLVDDQDTIRAMRLLFERMKIMVEPSGAIVLGAVMMHKEKFVGKKVGLILSGGNVDVRKLGEWFK